uniref:dephospho-CoA kinase domain-containing protein n=1 Tax=Myxine glutinosa TaxID=7769 RepID=UPI00358EF93A
MVAGMNHLHLKDLMNDSWSDPVFRREGSEMFLVGLTGGIASGKTAVASMFRDLGCVIIDADNIARQVVHRGQPALRRIVQRFGHEVLAEDGELDRSKLGQIVFSNPTKRRELEAITHPAVRREMVKLILGFLFRGYRYVILDVPLLFENEKLKSIVKRSIVVYCDPETQLQRLMHRDGFSAEEAECRLAAQIPLEEKRLLADHVIENSGGRDVTFRQVRHLHAQLEASWEHVPLRIILLILPGILGSLCFWLISWTFF